MLPQHCFIDSVKKKGIPEDHDPRAFRIFHFLCDFRESMDMDTIVIERRSNKSRDNFKQDPGPRQNSEDFPFGVFKTGSR